MLIINENCSIFLALFAAIGLIDKLRYMIILLDDMKAYTTLPLPGCTLLSFSNSGHFLAVVHKSNILIYDTISFNAVWTFKGHSGKVKIHFTPKMALENENLI